MAEHKHTVLTSLDDQINALDRMIKAAQAIKNMADNLDLGGVTMAVSREVTAQLVTDLEKQVKEKAYEIEMTAQFSRGRGADVSAKKEEISTKLNTLKSLAEDAKMSLSYANELFVDVSTKEGPKQAGPQTRSQSTPPTLPSSEAPNTNVAPPPRAQSAPPPRRSQLDNMSEPQLRIYVDKLLQTASNKLSSSNLSKLQTAKAGTHACMTAFEELGKLGASLKNTRSLPQKEKETYLKEIEKLQKQATAKEIALIPRLNKEAKNSPNEAKSKETKMEPVQPRSPGNR